MLLKATPHKEPVQYLGVYGFASIKREVITMYDGFVKIACATPDVKVADCNYNTERILALTKEAYDKGVKIICFPELSVTGYTCGDLFLQSALLDAAKNCLLKIVRETADMDIISIIGLPLVYNTKLYNCAAVVSGGEILGIVPKTNIPNYGEFYEARYFTPGLSSGHFLDIGYKKMISFGAAQTFVHHAMPELHFGVEICEDLWVAETPSAGLASRATIIFNLSASDEIIGKAEYRRTLVQAKSGSLLCAYAYADAGIGESTQDMVFAGHNLIVENGSILAESKLFEKGLTIADIDVYKLAAERRRCNTFTPSDTEDFTNLFSLNISKTSLDRAFPRKPFVPSSREALDRRCEEILTMQAVGLMTRLRHIGCTHAVVGLSGGLDSTLALIVMTHAFDMLKLDRAGITAVTMPCFGTTDRTYTNACTLAKAYGATLREIHIEDSVRQHFRDIGHDETVHNVTYENGQARERTQILMDVANQVGGIVIGTGDLSELALGWATYNGDHMSMYGVNASIPKTLVRYLTEYEAMHSGDELKRVLLDILDTPVSPELLPPDENGKIAQKTEDLVGPYELHDFFLYYMLRFGFPPKKIFRMAKCAFAGVYTDDVILKWERTFYRRFFSQQFKRSCLPDGPKVGSVTLSPRGDFRCPSDASARVWLSELEG
jgi:NAD+ synthase (glutamine-hydrolysing)